MHASVVFIDAQKVEGMTEFVSLGLQWFQLLRMCFSYRYCSWCNGGMLWCLVAAKPKPWDQILTVLNLYHTSFVVQFWNMDFLTYKDRKGEVASIPHAWSTWPPKQRRLGLFGHITGLPTVGPASAALSIAWLRAFTGLFTQELAETTYCRHWQHCCWCISTGCRSSNVESSRNGCAQWWWWI